MTSIDLELPENLPPEEIAGPTDYCNWVIKGRLLAGAYPGLRTEDDLHLLIQKILDAGVTTFVCLQTDEELKRFRPYKNYALSVNQNLQFVHFPIPDESIADPDEVHKLIEDLKDRLYKGEILYVHCWGGHGRTGTIIACLIARLFDLSGEKALELTQKYHNCRKFCKSTSPHDPSQFNQVIEIARRYQNEKLKSSAQQLHQPSKEGVKEDHNGAEVVV